MGNKGSKNITRTKQNAQPQDQPQDRTKHLGGSDIGILAGLHPTKTALDVYNEKLGLVAREPPDPLMIKGITLEPIAAQLYEDQTGLTLRKVPMLTHPEYPFLGGNIDREIEETGLPWEAKCPVSRRFRRWADEGMPQLLIAQLQFYMGLKKTDGGVWSIFNSDLWQSVNFPYEAAPNTIRMLFEIGITFWTEHIEKRIPPSGEAIEKPLVEFAVVPGEPTKIETPEFLNAMALLREAKQQVKRADALEEMAKERVKESLGDRMGKYYSSAGKLHWTLQPGRKTFDHKRLAQVQPLDRTKVAQVLQETLGAKKYAQIASAFGDCGLVLEDFFKQGESFEMLRPYFAKETDEE